MSAAVTVMRKAGAAVIEVDAPALDADRLIADNDVQKYEFKELINAYLATIPNAPAKSLADIIASGKFHKPSLERALAMSEAYQNGMQEPDYKERLLRNQRTRQVLISLMADDRLDALVYPLQKRLVVPITEPNQVDEMDLASVTGFPAIEYRRDFLNRRCNAARRTNRFGHFRPPLERRAFNSDRVWVRASDAFPQAT